VARRALVLLFFPVPLYMIMLASFRGDGGAAVLARHTIVSAFNLHGASVSGQQPSMSRPILHNRGADNLSALIDGTYEVHVG
jgi:hypothetical protein